jgi:Yip1 domain
MDLVARVKAILLMPKTEWVFIDGETGDTNYLFTNYVAILAAIPAVAWFIGYSIAGLGIGRALIVAILSYVLLSCVAWYVAALVIDALAPTFGGVKNMGSALKLAAYSWTAAWVAGVFHLIPVLSILGIIGILYSFYLLWLGIPVLMKAPADRATPYTAAVVVIMVVIIGLVQFVLFRLFL